MGEGEFGEEGEGVREESTRATAGEGGDELGEARGGGGRPS